MDILNKGRKKLMTMEEEMRGRRYMMDQEYYGRRMYDKGMGMGMGRHGLILVDNNYKTLAKFNDDLDDKDENY